MGKPLDRQYLTVLWLLFLLGYPISVWAATDIFQSTTGFTGAQALYALIMGSWGALATFTQKIAKGKVKTRWYIMLWADITCSTLAAAICFMVCIYKGVHPALTGVAGSLAGYGGATFLNWAYRKFISKADKMLDNLES